MDQPNLFVYLNDQALMREMMQIEAVSQFALTKADPLEHWIPQLEQTPCDVAVIEVNGFGAPEFERLRNSNLLSKVDFIFVSDGDPNLCLDEMMLHCANYHYRRPLDLELLEETLSDLFKQLTGVFDDKPHMLQSNLDQFGLLLGSSKVMRKLYRTIRKISPTNINVLLIGESGSGKELVSHTIHLASCRNGKPFVAVNCGALSPELVDSELFGHCKGAFTGAYKDRPGVFEQAVGGTLFFDEVTEMSHEHQVKLLRVLETGEYRPVGSHITKMAEVRVIAATNREPLQAIADEVLREDLYFRLAHFPIQVPALRERGEDMVGLARHFLAYHNAQNKYQKQIVPEALELISQYSWPGNVRELKHAIDQAYVLADETILPEHFNLSANTSCSNVKIPAGLKLEDMERKVIISTLEKNKGNKTDTAQQLGISVKTLYNKLDKYQQQGKSE